MTVEEAARHLGVSTRSVRKYIAQGLLSTRRADGSRRKWLVPDEVEELRKDKHDSTKRVPAVQRREVLETRAVLRRLRAEMDVVLRVLDMHEEPLRLDAGNAATLHEAALHEIKSTAWTLAELQQWADVLLRLNEEDLVVVAVTAGTRPWSAFLRLCVDMIVYVYEQPSYKTDLELQLLHRKLTEARRRLRVTALCYDDMYNREQDKELKRAALLDSPSSVREALRSRVQKMVPK